MRKEVINMIYIGLIIGVIATFVISALCKKIYNDGWRTGFRENIDSNRGYVDDAYERGYQEGYSKGLIDKDYN